MRTARTMATAATLLAFAPAVAAAGTISPNYDGRYQGRAQVVDPLSEEACHPFAVPDLRISGGDASATMENGRALRGFVTDDGFFTGRYEFANGKGRLEGRIDSDGELVGGLISPDGSCKWIVRLDRRSGSG